MQNLYLAARFY